MDRITAEEIQRARQKRVWLEINGTSWAFNTFRDLMVDCTNLCPMAKSVREDHFVIGDVACYRKRESIVLDDVEYTEEMEILLRSIIVRLLAKY